MKAIRLTINNVGIIGNTVIELDKPLLLFYGDLMQGKSTILNAFKWCLGGSFPADIMKHGEKEASVLFEFQEDVGPGSISRSWYINKEGVTTPRPVQFIRAGKPIPKPDAEIKKFLNPYLLDNDFLKNMSETERKAYFVKLFGVDTSDIDRDINTAAEEAKTLRIEIKAFGEIDTAEVKPIDVTAIREQRQKIIDDHAAEVTAHNVKVESINQKHTADCDAIAAENRAIVSHNDKRKQASEKIAENAITIQGLEAQIVALRSKNDGWLKWLQDNPALTEREIPVRPDIPLAPVTPDVSALDAQISEAAAVAVRVEQYQKNLKRAEEKAAKEKRLSVLEADQRILKTKKVSRLAECGEKSGIKDLIFNEDGSFAFKGTSAGMMSTSQIMDLSQELSALYPAGFGLDLIDRAESLGFAIGKNVAEFVEKAKRENKTILAAIVGEKPATAPPEVGVFVVESGEVKQ